MRFLSDLLGRIGGRFMSLVNARINRAAIAELGIEAGDKILDVGFGGGVAFAPVLARARPGRLTGIEISEALVSVAATRFRRAIAEELLEVKLGDAARLPLAGGAFDRVLSVNTLQQWANAERVFGEVLRVLRPGGRFVLAFRRPEYVKRFAPGARLMRLYGADEVVGLLKKAGFTEARILPETVAGRETGYLLAIAERPESQARAERRRARKRR